MYGRRSVVVGSVVGGADGGLAAEIGDSRLAYGKMRRVHRFPGGGEGFEGSALRHLGGQHGFVGLGDGVEVGCEPGALVGGIAASA